MNYSTNDNQIPFFKREVTTAPPSTESLNNSTGNLKKSPKNHDVVSNLRSSSKPSHFRNPYMLFSVHKYQELTRSRGKMNRQDLAQAVQNAWNELAPNERLYWFQNAYIDRTKQPKNKLESRASRGLLLKKQHSLNLNDPRFKEIDSADYNNVFPQRRSTHHDFVLRKQNSLNFRDLDSRDTEMKIESVSSNRSMFVRSLSNSDVYQSSSSNNTNNHNIDVYNKLLNQYSMIIESASKERDNITVNFCNSQKNKSSSTDHPSLHNSMVVFPNDNMGGEELTHSEYAALMKGYKDIIDDAMMQKTAVEFKLKSCHSNKNDRRSSDSKLHQVRNGKSYASTVMSNNLTDGNFDDHLENDDYNEFSSLHNRKHEMQSSEFDEACQVRMSIDLLPPWETLESEFILQEKDFSHASIPKIDILSTNNNNIGILSDVHGSCIPNVDMSNNNVNHTSIKNDFSLVASSSSSLKNISNMATSDHTNGGSIPKVSLHRDEVKTTTSNKFRSHHGNTSIPTVSFHREDNIINNNNNIKLQDLSILKRRKGLLWTEMDKDNIGMTMNYNHQLVQQTWLNAKNILSPMFEDDVITDHPPEYISFATTSSAVAVAAAALTSTDEDGVNNMDENPFVFKQQFDNNNNKINKNYDANGNDHDGCIDWESLNDLDDESFH